jgi:HEAT repeat protein
MSTALCDVTTCISSVQCRDQFRESGGLSKLTEFLNNQEWNDLHALAVDVLSLCLLKPKGLEELHSSNCLQRLLESINNSQLPLMKTKATLAIARASADITSQKLLHDQHAEKVFIQLLTSQDESVLCAACEALIQLSSFASSRLTIGLEEGIPKLIQLTQHAGPNVRCSAVHALSSVITEAPSNAIIAGEAGAIEHIVSLLSDDLALSRVYAISCVINMSPNGTLRSEIIEQGAISALVQCMPHIDSYVQQTALEAIALLAVDSVARQQFPIEDVPCLVNLLVSSNTDVSRCAAWAISMLAYNRKIAENVLKSNGLDILQQLLKQSTHRDVLEHSQIAIDRLLVGCLPAQYYIKGYLSFHDTLIGTEFWDVGMAETDRGFLTLEDLVAIAPQLNKYINIM